MTIDQAMTHALSLEQAGKLVEAESFYRQILNVAPDHAPALERLATIAHLCGQAEAAAKIAARAAANGPTANAFTVLGAALHQLKKLPEAEAALREAQRLAPHNPASHFNLGMVLFEMRRPAESRVAYARALELKPDFAEAHHGMMTVEGDLGAFAAAVESGRRAQQLGLNTARFWGDFGIALHETGDLKAAIKAEEKAVAVDPADATMHFNLSQLLLLDGQFERGWEEHEWRWDSPGLPSPKRNFRQPMWNPASSARTVLLHAEQGVGDVIMAARYIPMVAERARVVVECQPELVELIRTARGVEKVIPRGENLGEFDAHVPFLSLPFVFGTSVETIPNVVPYLSTNPEKLKRWREGIGDEKRLKVGVVWAGSPTHLNDVNRSMPFAQLAAIARVEGVTFISLQKGARCADAKGAHWLLDWTEEIHDYTDTAALVESLDLVVTVDTSVAHVAGALAKRVWLMLPFAPDWRWLARAEHSSPWYPTMRLFRQTVPRQWGDVVERVAQELGDLSFQTGIPH